MQGPPTVAEATVTICNSHGMHGRPASQFVRVANRYPEAEVFVEKGDERVNGKSIFGLMMLAAGPGTVLKIITSGPGAAELAEELRLLIESRFGEEEQVG